MKKTIIKNQNEWKKIGFTGEETQQWTNAGAKTDDYEFVAWLRDTKNLTPEWITTYQEDYQILGERFKKYGLCSECNQPNTGEKWCQPCNASHLQKDFANWTSQDPQIDQFIQKYQLEATEANKFIEWIPYEQFTEIEHLADGSSGKFYKAKWNAESRQWQREKDNKIYREVVLKSPHNSQNITAEFLQEVSNHKIIDDWFNNIVPCYGISQAPVTKDYLMVMQYMPEGNLRQYLSKNSRELSLKDKLSQLVNIVQGLKDIHQKGLVHRNFHTGNILKGIERTACLITGLGLCRPVNEVNQEDKVYGVMPYVAPEVLQSQPYTPASDIYSFGIVAYEVLTGLLPYYERNHDMHLGIEICWGLRPQFQIKIPPLLEDLIKKCWDADPCQRPTVNELERILRSWGQENTEFKTQLQIAEEHNQALLEEIKFPKYQIHHGAVYTSRLLPVEEITNLLKQSQSGAEQTSKILYNPPKTPL